MADPATATPDPTDIDAYLAKTGMMTRPQIDAMRKELLGNYEGAAQKEIGAIDQGGAERRKLIGQGIPSPATPKLEDQPQPPNNQPQSPFQAFGSPAVFLASLGSLFTRHPLKVALDSAAAAMKGYHEGDQQAAQAAQERWKEATQAAINQNKTELEKYNAAWKSTEHDVAERQAKMQAIAAGVQDEVMSAAIKTGNWDRVWHLLDKREDALNKLESTQFGGDPVLAQAIAKGKAAPITGFALKNPAGKATMDMVYQYNPDYDAAVDWYAKLGAAKVTAAAEPRAEAAALSKLVQQKVAIGQFESLAKKNGRILIDLVDKVDTTGIPVIERWTRAGKRAIAGDPDVSEFNTQLVAYRNEVAKILTNPNMTGVLSVNAQREAEHFIAGDDSARSIRAVVRLLEGDMDRRQESLQEELDATRAALKGDQEPGGKKTGDVTSTPPGSMLKEGEPTEVRNKATGEVQTWTLQNGKPVKVK